MEDGEGAVSAAACASLSEETRLPAELIRRFSHMWAQRDPPHFAKVTPDGTLEPDALAELVRALKVPSALLCASIARVIGEGGSASFPQFVRGYASLHSRTLREALPFAFRVFDLDGDGRLKQEEFTAVLNETMAMQNLDSSQLRKVLLAPTPEHEKVEGISFDSFRYFSSLSSQTILACCGFMLHVHDFYVPLVPFGSAEEEAQEEAAARREEMRRRAREFTGGVPEQAGQPTEDDPELNPFADPDFLAALEDMRTTPEERAERHKEEGNAAMKHGGKAALDKAVEEYGKGLDEKCRDDLLVATLLGNRAAAYTMLRNWGKALADASAALEMGVLPTPSSLRAARRGAQAALKLGKLQVARSLHSQAVELAGGDGGEELEAIDEGITLAEEARRKKRLMEEAKEKMAEELRRAVDGRRIVLRDFEDERIREQCVGSSSGARIWYEAEADQLHFPVLLLYPESAMSDFIQVS